MSTLVSILLSAAPIFVRFSTWNDTDNVLNTCISLLPFIVAFPSSYISGYASRDEKGEHVARHTIYALAFLASIGGIKWDVAVDAWKYEEQEWPEYLVMYFIFGSVSLWWFVIAHIMENRKTLGWSFTHQGDVVVLPFTLIAISTFANLIPDEAFRFSRSIVFLVPCIVGWSTIMLIAYTGFALSQTTTLDNPAFTTVTLTGFYVAELQLLLIETRSSPTLYIVATPIVAVLAQLCNRYDDPPIIYGNTNAGTLLISAVLGIGGGAVLSMRYGMTAYFVCVYVSATVSIGLRYTCGKKWLLPGTLVSTLYSVIALSFITSVHNRFIDIVAIWTVYFVILSLVSRIAPSVCDDTIPPIPHLKGNMPQLNYGVCSVSGIAKLLDFPLCTTRHVYDRSLKWTVPFFDKVDSDCPPEFVGIWWMEHNTFPMELITVHRRKWSKQGATALFWNGRDITFHPSFSGYVMSIFGNITFTRMTVIDDRWIRTDSYKTRLGLLYSTFWLYRVDSDFMVRLVYDEDWNVIWRYNMKRIASAPNVPTRHMSDFLSSQGGKSFVLKLS